MLRPLLALAASAVLAGSAVATPGDGKDRRIMLENVSGQAIYEFYASPWDSGDWEEDLLGSNVLPTGQSRMATIDNGTSECVYDLKVVMRDRSTRVRARQNICSITRWTIGNGTDVVT